MPTRQPDAVIASIMSLGFTEMEAEAYAQLCKSNGATGYAVAKAIHKPHANVYQALTALEHKGAVLFKEGTTRTYSAVPPSELVEHLRKRMQSNLATAKATLAPLEQPYVQDEGLYRLRTQAQVLAKAVAMIEVADECVLIYAGPTAMVELRPTLEQAIAAGVRVAGLVLREEDRLPGARLHISGIGTRIEAAWPDFPLLLVADAREALLAPFAPEAQPQNPAVWTRSVFLCSLFHNALTSDAVLHSLPVIGEIVSPNLRLFDMIPSAIREMVGGEEGIPQRAAAE